MDNDSTEPNLPELIDTLVEQLWTMADTLVMVGQAQRGLGQKTTTAEDARQVLIKLAKEFDALAETPNRNTASNVK